MALSRRDLPGLAVAVIACEVVGGLPGVVTATRIDTWYADLARPALAPPNWVFGPVWTLLFALLGVAAYLVYRDGTGRERTVALGLFGGQFALNVAWTLVFFGARSLGGGLVVIAVLWLAILATLLAFRRVGPVAGYLLVPYLAWVSFAASLNYGFWALN
jgi:tryptophan-rich sensory protein